MRIWKFDIKMVDYQQVMMPVGAKILSVQVQKGVVVLWALCDEFQDFEARSITVFGTGHPIPDDWSSEGYIGTVQLAEGDLVFHILEGGY